MFLEILIASFVIMLAALGGAISFWKIIGQKIERNLGILISFTAGIFIFVSYELGNEAIIHSKTTGIGFMWIIVGAVGIWLLFKLIPHFHEHGNKSLDVRKILTGNAIHNIGDGVLLAAAFSVDLKLGIITTLSVFIHELVQETSIFFVLRKIGYTVKKAIFINFAVSGTILIGSIGSVILLSFFHALEAPLLGISAGVFLIIVLQDLIPHSIKESCRDRCFFSHILAFIIGILIMLLISLLVPHTHDYHHDYHAYGGFYKSSSII